ncbi:uncharacterized [Tachysurus ichikawai]
MDSEELKDKYKGGDAGKWDMQQQAQVLSLCSLNLQSVWADGETLGPGMSVIVALLCCRLVSWDCKDLYWWTNKHTGAMQDDPLHFQAGLCDFFRCHIPSWVRTSGSSGSCIWHTDFRSSLQAVM